MKGNKKMKNSTKKGRRWIYLLFFTIGILFLLGLLLTPANPLHLVLICSILFAIGLYAFKERSFIFALKVFIISFIALSLIFGAFLIIWTAHEHTGAISIEKFDTLEEILEKYRPPEKVEYVEITEEELKEYPALAKAISGEGCKKLNEDSWELEVHLDEWIRTFEFIEGKCKDVPFINGPFIKIGEKYYEVLLGTVTGPGVPDSKEVIHIKKFDTPEEILEEYRPHIKVEPIEITEEELEEYPALKKAISGEGCTKYNEDRWSLKVHPKEYKRTSLFIGKKRHEYLFSMDRELEGDLNKGIITLELKNAFESKGFQLSENFTIGIIKYDSVYDKWRIYDEERGKSYDVWEEDGKLNVYDGKARYSCFKVGEKYYEVGFPTA